MATLKVTIHEARDLPVMDRATGLADPYVVVSLNAESYTTEIDMGTCNPVWNKHVRFDAANILTLQEDPLEFRVYDHDIVTRDDLIGLLFVDLNTIIGRDVPTLSGWFPLYDTMAGIRGELRVSMKIKFHAAENPAAPKVPLRQVRVMPNSGTITGALVEEQQSQISALISSSNQQTVARLKVSSEPAVSLGAPTNPPTMLASPALQFQLADPSEYAPLSYVRSHQPSLTTEEEGVHIFAMSRLDPSVFRVEMMLSMVEELIVKADPEHSRFTTLRSSRATNEARLLQLFKLSGKVRRQLARKVLGLHCNCVLGYEERFDLEPNGIIVRAYGTPCVVSSVSISVREMPLAQIPAANLPPSMASSLIIQNAQSQLDSAQLGLFPAVCLPPEGPNEAVSRASQPREDEAGMGAADDGMTPMSTFVLMSSSVNANPSTARGLPAVNSPVDPDEKLLPPQQAERRVNAVTTTRSQIVTLTLTDVPSGTLHHIGGLVSARSVKLVSKLKSKVSISQERDAWWGELREEVKYNARTLHCNAIIAYEETAVYDQEDVVMLSISGTAVVLDTTWLSMRCGPENLYHRLHHRLLTKKACAILHLYHHHHHSHEAGGGDNTQHSAPEGFLCTVCRRKPVPEVILSSSALPLDLVTEGGFVLVQAAVTKTKPNVKGAELALCLSQAIPFLEFSLHKQLMFKMQLERMNAAFGLQVKFAVCSHVIVSTLTATACRVVGLPVPLSPKLEFWDVDILPPDIVTRLRHAVDRSKGNVSKRSKVHGGRSTSNLPLIRSGNTNHHHHHHQKHHSPQKTPPHTSNNSVVNTLSSPNSTGCCDAMGHQATQSHCNNSETLSSTSSSAQCSSDESSSSSRSSCSSHETWISSPERSEADSGDDADDMDSYGKRNKEGGVTEYVVTIDDVEEAELMLGMLNGECFSSQGSPPTALRMDDVVFTIPYVPQEPNDYAAFQERIFMSRRYSVRSAHGDSDQEMSTTFVNNCFINARMAFLAQLRRIAVRRRVSIRDDLRVFQFRVHCVFEPNTEDFHMIFEGIVCGSYRHHNAPHDDSATRSARSFPPESGAVGCHDEKRRKFLHDLQGRSFFESEALLLASVASGGLQKIHQMHHLAHRQKNVYLTPMSTDESMTAEGHNQNESEFVDGGDISALLLLQIDGGAGCKSTRDMCSGCPILPNSDDGRRARRLKRNVFVQSNAPYTLPFVFRRDSLRNDSLSVFEGKSASAAGVTYEEGRHVEGRPQFSTRAQVAEQTRRTGMFQRQLQALTSLASATLRNFADKVGIVSEAPPHASGTNSCGGSPVRDAANEKGPATVRPTRTGTSLRSSTTAGASGRPSSGLIHQPLQPCNRIPCDRTLLMQVEDEVFITPLSYIPAAAVAKYLGRFSHHFIRESYAVYTADALGKFYMQTDLEVHSVVRGFVKAMGGNALLSHFVQIHEVWDSDGSGCAFLCLSVTGHVAVVTREVVSGVGDSLSS